MIKFFKYIKTTSICFLIVISTVFLFKCVFFLSVTNKYYLKNNEFKDLDEVDVGIFGHSHTLNGIDENQLNNSSKLHFENFSVSGNPLYYTCPLIQNIIDNNQNMKVVIEIGSNNLDERWITKSIFDEKQFFRFKNSFYYILFDKDTDFLQHNILEFLYKGLLHLPIYNFNGSYTYETNMEKAYENYPKLLDESKEKPSKPYDESLEIERLTKLIENNRNVSFVLIRTPEHQRNKDFYPNYDTKYINLMTTFKKYKNVEVKDYIDFKLSDDSFFDFNHLSLKGRKIFKSYFLKDNFQD